jgi:purine-binding chemotaxis protein CheW
MDRKIVGFRLKDENFAFDIMKVVEIIRLKEITEVPTAPAFIEGVINLRGKIIPIIDLRQRFKVEIIDRDRKYRIIIVELFKNQLVGVIVDEVEKVIQVKEEQVLPAPATVTEAGGRYIDSIVKIDDRIIVMLDIDKIFSESEQVELKEIINLSGGKIEESFGS